MRRAASHFERREWDKALTQYGQALAEFPNDVAALTGLGLVYHNLQQLDKALSAYQRSRQAGADDPAVLQRLADVQERLKRLDEAADTYVALANHALQERDINSAVQSWMRAVQLAPGHPIARLNLAKAYASQGYTQAAVKEYLDLANAFQSEGRPDQAMNICQQALMLDPRNRAVLNLMRSLRSLLEPAETPARVAEPIPVTDLDDLSFEDEPSPSQRDEGSPVDNARQQALSALAEAVFEEDLATVTASRSPSASPLTKQEIDTLIGQTLDFHRQGLLDDGVAAYERLLEVGLDRPEVHFNLGLLYQEKTRWREAVRHLSMVGDHEDYRLGALLVMGECYRAQGRIDLALSNLLEVLKLVELDLVSRDRRDGVVQLYESLADSYATKGDPEQTRHFIDSLIRFLNNKGWEDKVREIRERLDNVTGEGVAMSLAEIVAVPGSEAVLGSMATIQELVNQGTIYTAIEEAYDAICISPTYPPLHLQLGEVLLSQGQFEEAAAKFLTVAQLYLARGDARAAIGVYRRLLRASPMDVTVRARLIDLLISQEAIDEALEDYLALGEAYFQLAQIDSALEKYDEALRLTPQASDEDSWTVRLLHRVGDIYLQRADWREALSIYRRSKQVSPYDERTGLNLIDLYYKMGRPREALAELDTLVGHLFKEQKPEKALAILQDSVQMRPEEESLRFRLAQACLSLGRKEKAVAELDALGDLQLRAGRTQQAVKTIRSIIKINPSNVESYRQLLHQVTGQRS
jgi:tetratricopeptide (TPR) repeat protein